MTIPPGDAYVATLTLLAVRAADATICPSEVARTLAKPAGADAKGADWRALMPVVHDAVDRLAAEGQVRLSWKGRQLSSRAGPYRIGRAPQPAVRADDEA
jgi:hypothetical protein